mmetsp:Transcript_99794/g.291187  ORF Transcript_99794/g.291187 Transcript_99794/m.291187 type:complete len:283 (-) Transcript_99794:115-963(-)
MDQGSEVPASGEVSAHGEVPARGEKRARSASGEKDKEWRRTVVRWGFFASLGLVALYEYAIRFPQDSELHQPLDSLEGADAELGGLAFAQELEAAKADHELDYVLEDVRAEFKDKYSDKARPLLCSGCKLAAERAGEELSAWNASGQQDPTALLSVASKALKAACEDLPSPIVVAPTSGKRGASFIVYEAPPGAKALSGVELRKAEVARRSAQRLCKVLLSDARIGILEALIRRKVPHQKHHGPGEAMNDNWERWLCARHARLCKRYEVEEDDEDEDEEGEL